MARKKKTSDKPNPADKSAAAVEQPVDTKAMPNDAVTPTPDDAVTPTATATQLDDGDTNGDTSTGKGGEASNKTSVQRTGALDLASHNSAEADHVGEHGSFPTWVKVLIIMLFGAGIALWGGPRLANHLPGGLEPVARFLTPGSVRQAKEFEARLAQLETARPAAIATDDIRAVVLDTMAQSIESAVRQGIAENLALVKSEMNSLRDAIAAVDGAELGARLATAEITMQGLDAQINSLSSQVTEAIAVGLAEQGQMSADQAAAYQANIERLKAEIGQLASLQGAVDHKIDELAATNTRLNQEAAAVAERAEVQTREITDAAEVVSALTDIESALESGSEFRAALDILAAVTGDQDLSALNAIADNGAIALSQLQAEFPPLAHDALRASMRADGAGVLGSGLSFLKSYIATRSLKPLPGKGTNPVLSRIDAALDAGDFATVLTEAEGLTATARAPLGGWLRNITTLAAAQTSFADVSARFPSL